MQWWGDGCAHCSSGSGDKGGVRVAVEVGLVVVTLIAYKLSQNYVPMLLLKFFVTFTLGF